MRQEQGVTDEMTYCVEVTNKRVLSALRGGQYINSLFWRDLQNKDPTCYDTLLEIIKCKIINEELNYHRSTPIKDFYLLRDNEEEVSSPI